MLSRRSFLRWAGGAAAAAATVAVLPALPSLPALVLDPEKALWVPGAKTIFIPEVRLARPRLAEVVGSNGQLLSRWMIDHNGLAVPITPEGYRAGYEIIDSMSDILAPKGLHMTVAHDGSTWSSRGPKNIVTKDRDDEYRVYRAR
jgi:hypothetical protein